MSLSTRFSVATHVLTSLAMAQGEPRRSCDLAASAGSHPTVIRQLLSRLCDSGLVKSRLGPGGGAMIGRDPRSISLLDIYRAVEMPGIVTMHEPERDQPCRVARNINDVLRPATDRAEQAFSETLSRTSLADLVDSIRAREQS